MRTRSIRSLIYFAAGLGLIAALFATAEYFDAALAVACSPTSSISCAAVAKSGLTTTLGVPDWAWGLAGFVAILVAATLAERHRKDIRYTYALLGLTTAGVGLSMYLLYVELFRIGALCPVCASAYAFGILAWIGAILLTRRMTARLQARARAPGPDAEPSA
jgi:uncharacterized membrane protein